MGPAHQDELLQQLVDDELDPSLRREVEERLSENPAAARTVRDLRRLRSLMKTARDAQLEHLDSDMLFSRISEELEGAPEAPPPTGHKALSFWHMLKRHPLKATGGTLALAATALLAADLALKAPDPGVAGESADAASSLLRKGPQIVQVDFGRSTGTVFEITLENGASTPVVWINDEE